ncbi:hypothetical protein CLOHYLEM_07549 [[Clostridium] hylemonae DSM 15053]|uniref:Uncharacterized protein n=1 Tax=[Clostridium] hylemonae DSM 15053 TaxID=553973 RepID=C0C612_9FIRM|nr:hypothetical protein CLOHYLEM_07549 [[Clostridium] hylemonae DSM 15053]
MGAIEKMIFDERNGLWHEKKGHYSLPCITSRRRKDDRIV